MDFALFLFYFFGAVLLASAAMVVFIAGYATSKWWSSTESSTPQAALDAVDRCWLDPLMVRHATAQSVATCRLAARHNTQPD